jgi:hypothetical protein
VEESDNSGRVFTAIMRECPSLKTWNRFILPLMKIETEKLKMLAVIEAKRREYKYSKEKGVYE